MKFEDNLIELRKKVGLSQEQLAEKLNVTRQTISKWELGQTKPDVDKLREMANIFGVDVNGLINCNQKEDKSKISENDNLTEEPISNEKNKPKKEKNRKFILYIVILLLIGSISLLCYRFVNYKVEHKNERQSIFDKILNFGNNQNSNMEDNIDYIEDTYNKVVDDISISSFNGSFELYAGNVNGFLLEGYMSDLITSNKKNSNHQISLIFDGNNYGNDTDKISELKNSLGKWQQYDLSFNYDADGYINEFVVTTQ